MESIWFTILEAVIGWLILMLVGTNLIGFLVRGIVQSDPIDQAAKALHDSENAFLRSEAARHRRINLILTIVVALVTCFLVYLLFHFWNWGVAGVAVIMMISRIPDLLWEIRTGQKVTKFNKPTGVGYTLLGFVYLLALPLLWLALYTLQSAKP